MTGGDRIQFAVARSDLAGTQAVARISRDGQTLGEGYGESDWTAPTFRAALEVVDDEGRLINTAYLSGTYLAAGMGNRTLNTFKDGNIRAGESVDGYLSYTNPSSYVARGNFNAEADCKMDNAVDFALYGTPEAMWVTFDYADAPDWSASSSDMNLAAGNGTTALSERWVMTPYLLEVSADGPNVPIKASCTFYTVEATLHVKTNQLGG